MAFNAPIGTQAERDTGIFWPGHWIDANPYLSRYALGFHTGADLNLNFPDFDIDKHAEVVAIGDGKVTYARLYSTTVWGNIIVIDHGLVDGKPLFSRYGHVENLRVKQNDLVTAGQHIGNVGNAEGLFPYHLHFDISTTSELLTSPGHWPGNNEAGVRLHYVDPKAWLQSHFRRSASAGRTAHQPGAEALTPSTYTVVATLGLRVRENHSRSARQVGILAPGAEVIIDDTKLETQDGYIWAPIVAGEFSGNYVAMGPSDRSDVYLSKTSPNG